jgi:hypothetical protein
MFQSTYPENLNLFGNFRCIEQFRISLIRTEGHGYNQNLSFDFIYTIYSNHIFQNFVNFPVSVSYDFSIQTAKVENSEST